MLQRQSVEIEPDTREPARKQLSIALLFPGHMLTDHLAYGDGLVAFGFISALAQRGHRLHVIAQRVAIAQPLPPNVTIHTIGGSAQAGVVERGVFVLRSRAVVAQLLRREAIDVVHQLNPVCNGMSVGMWGLPLPVVLGTFVANWPDESPPPSAWSMQLAMWLSARARVGVLRLQERLASAFLVTTPAALSRFSCTTHVLDRVHWLPHGIDVSAFAPAERASGSGMQILYLASVAVKKGIFTLLDAFEIVRETLPDATLCIAGDGPAFEKMQEYVASMKSRSAIEVLGPVRRTAVPALMADSAVYCLPSFGEPYATTVIEAMACAKPIVVTASGGIRDMVSDAGGRRVEPGNVDQLAAALVEILASPTLQAQMGTHNRATAEQQYDWPRVIEKLELIYDWVLQRRATR